ncbi:MAG: NAD-dependent epimerase/dehydratase family protein [Flavobacteriaceae bacterium]|nr:NAD-dependent epimerase/dehydratase family protein [Flavobacteriaceae bacterium]
MQRKTLIIGACGQIGSELVRILRAQQGTDNIIATDIKASNREVVDSGIFEILDAKSREEIRSAIERHNIGTVYLMAALLSAKAEQYPEKAWRLNMSSLFNVLELAREGLINRIFWPSSIAVFGPTTPKVNTPQHTIMEPTTVYGITKQVGERWCDYYFSRYGVDIRSIRYPGIISWRTAPGGGTTDYAVEIFHEALEKGHYNCFLSEDTRLPMMFMDDAIKATLDIMNAPSEDVLIRSSYNLEGVSFSPGELVASIQEHLPEFTVEYNPDFRQAIADSWPNSIDDTPAREHWGWDHNFNLKDITAEMLTKLRQSSMI